MARCDSLTSRRVRMNEVNPSEPMGFDIWKSPSSSSEG